ncbi:MAG: hypothetical protein H6733_07785 [Alphaproteobacteria bacterium]|nr:hypothetical protein [Alphaproteobacteria bacterium]
MPEPVRTTRQAPVPSQASATTDTQRRVLVVVPASAVRHAGPAQRTALTVLADAPWPALAEQAERGVPVVVGASPNRRLADALARELTTRHDLPVAVLDPTASPWLLAAFAMVAAAVAMLILSGLTAAFGAAWAPVVLVFLALASVGGSVGAALRSRAAVADERAARHGAEEVGRATTAWPEVWALLRDLRHRSLDPALPATAAADLWSALDRAEERLLSGVSPDGVTEELRAARAALADEGDPGLTNASSALRTAARAARAALGEVEGARPRPPRSTERS